MTISLQPILPGEVTGPLLHLDLPISFWGGIDFETAKLIDRTHPQCGARIDGVCLSLPMIQGSGATPGSIAAMMKAEIAPAGIITEVFELNVLAGLMVGKRLYGVVCPYFVASRDQRKVLAAYASCHIDDAGFVSFSNND